MTVRVIVAVRPAVLDVEVQEAVGQDIVEVGTDAGHAAIIFDVGAAESNGAQMIGVSNAAPENSGVERVASRKRVAILDPGHNSSPSR